MGLNPFKLKEEAEKRNSDGSSGHCWFVCMAGSAFPGAGIITNVFVDIVETFWSGTDSIEDCAANRRGNVYSWKAVAIHYFSRECPEDYCDKQCGTKPPGKTIRGG
jgi:hypothetical protein